MNPRPSSDESRIYPKISDEYSVVPTAPPVTPSMEAKKKQCVSTSTKLRLYALVKFAIVVYMVMSRSWTEAYAPFVIGFLLVDIILLIGSLLQDFCTLTLAAVLSIFVLFISITLLVFVPIFISSISAADSRTLPFPPEFKLSLVTEIINSFPNQQEDKITTRFLSGMEAGLNAQMILMAIVFATWTQFRLMNKALNEKLDVVVKKNADRKAQKKNALWA